MWISELSQRTDVPVATIKFYLREGLLRPGEAVGATRAVYDEEHERRLRLIRALVGPGGLSLAAVRAVLAALADESCTMHRMIGSAHQALAPVPREPARATRRRVDALLDRLGWQVRPDSQPRDELAAALDAFDAVGDELPDDLLETYATAARQVGSADVAALPATGDPSDILERAVVVTVLGEPVLLALRRLAQEHASAHRYGGL